MSKIMSLVNKSKNKLKTKAKKKLVNDKSKCLAYLFPNNTTGQAKAKIIHFIDIIRDCDDAFNKRIIFDEKIRELSVKVNMFEDKSNASVQNLLNNMYNNNYCMTAFLSEKEKLSYDTAWFNRIKQDFISCLNDVDAVKIVNEIF